MGYAMSETINEAKTISLTKLKVLKRDGITSVPFCQDKIRHALKKAFLSTIAQGSMLSQGMLESIEKVTQEATELLLSSKKSVTVEQIQDLLEKKLMSYQFHHVAKNFILYREKQSQRREQSTHQSQEVILKISDEQTVTLTYDDIIHLIKDYSDDLQDIDPDLIAQEVFKGTYHEMSQQDFNQVLIMATRTLIETDPNYSFVAARLLQTSLVQDVASYLEVDTNNDDYYQQAFIKAIDKGIENEMLDPKLKTFDLEKLAANLETSRDKNFQYLGIQTLFDRYFIHDKKIRYELPQCFFMRVAMGLALEEKEKDNKAIEFYNLLSSFDFMSSTPTLFNSGTTRSQLSSCYLTTVPDDLYGIYGAIRDNALLSKYAGGLGNDWTNVRGMNSHIKGTNGQSQGVIPFLKVVNDTAIAVNQGGKRKGAVCAYLETWHRDIEEFQELRKNTGDDRRRTHDMNTANWVPDLFMERVLTDDKWTLFSPDDTPDLHDLFGQAFKDRYEFYEEKAEKGLLPNAKTVNAKQLWRKMLGMLFETGHPWVTFKDPCNIRSPQQHTGVVHSSNLCTEITLNTSEDEIAVCNLGSINLAQHIKDGKIDEVKLEKTIKTAIRMLDNVIDINYYSVPQAKESNFKHRPIGMGIMGFQDALYQLGYPYQSQETLEFADLSMETVSYYAIKASALLAQERGSYRTFEGSLWSQKILPIDSIELLKKERGARFCDIDQGTTKDWSEIRELCAKGMRNSNVLAIAPTATIANICGVNQSIEPAYQNLFVKSNLSGEFTMINQYLVKTLKKHGLWDQSMIHDLKYFDGQLGAIERVPLEIKELFKTAFEVDQTFLIDAASRRQKWIDQSQSLNLYIAKPSGQLINKIYTHAWLKGLKTTYYCRSLGATDTEKSTIHDAKLNAVNSVPTTGQSCSIDNPECEACQ